MEARSAFIAAALVGIAGLAIYFAPAPKKRKVIPRVSKAGPQPETELDGVDPLLKLKQRIKAPRQAPEGFDWYYNSLLNAFSLVPKGWEVDDKKDGNPCFDVVPEEKGEVGTYSRFSVFGMMMDKSKGLTIDKMAQGLSSSLVKTGKEITMDWSISAISTERSPVYGTKDLMYVSDTTTCLTELVYNPLTETIYVVQFEAPTSQWDEMFSKIGSVLIGSMEPNIAR